MNSTHDKRRRDRPDAVGQRPEGVCVLLVLRVCVTLASQVK